MLLFKIHILVIQGTCTIIVLAEVCQDLFNERLISNISIATNKKLCIIFFLCVLVLEYNIIYVWWYRFLLMRNYFWQHVTQSWCLRSHNTDWKEKHSQKKKGRAESKISITGRSLLIVPYFNKIGWDMTPVFCMCVDLINGDFNVCFHRGEGSSKQAELSDSVPLPAVSLFLGCLYFVSWVFCVLRYNFPIFILKLIFFTVCRFGRKT